MGCLPRHICPEDPLPPETGVVQTHNHVEMQPAVNPTDFSGVCLVAWSSYSWEPKSEALLYGLWQAWKSRLICKV